MDQRLNTLESEIVDYKPTAEQEWDMNILDKQFIEIQAHAERYCRKIIKP